MRVKDVMNSEVYILHEEDSVLQASNFMKKERIRNLPVVDKKHELVGLITLREIVDALSKDAHQVKVGEVMIKDREVKAVTPETPLKGAVEIMILNRFGSLPVIDTDKKLLGMLTELDLLKKLYSMSELPIDFYRFEERKTSFKF